MPDHESDMWRRAFVRLVKRGANPAQGNVLGVALSERHVRGYRNSRGQNNKVVNRFHIVSPHYNNRFVWTRLESRAIIFTVAGLFDGTKHMGWISKITYADGRYYALGGAMPIQ